MPKITLGYGITRNFGSGWQDWRTLQWGPSWLRVPTHVQYSRLDSSGQSLESNGVCSKNETGSTVESTWVTGSLVIRRNRKCKQYFEDGRKVVWWSPSDLLETHRFWWNLRKHSRAMIQNKHTASRPHEFYLRLRYFDYSLKNSLLKIFLQLLSSTWN